MSRARTPLLALIASALAMLWLAGCSTAPLPQTQSSTTAAADAQPTGPATAQLAQADPRPIGPAPRPTLPARVRSADGSTTVVRDISRIVALDQYGTYGTTVVALGLRQQLVGRDIATDFPAVRDVPVLNPSGQQVNVEAVIRQRPTVLLTDASLPGVLAALPQLKAAGIPVVQLQTIREVTQTSRQLQQVADALGVPAAGQALVRRTQSQISQARAATPQGAASPRIAFIYARGTALMILGGPGSGADALIQLIGGQDAGTAAGLTRPFTTLTSEGLIKARPDVLLMMTGGLRSVGGIDGLLKVPGVAQTPAGQQRRVIDMADGQLLSFGPRTGEVALALSRALRSP